MAIEKKANFIRKIITLFKIDLGQRELRATTKGKLIALEFIKQCKNKRALDVGCREGIQSKFLEKKGYEVTSIDIEKSYKKCIVVDVNKKLPFKNNYFDFVWCSEVIEHLDDPKKTIDEFRRVLKNNGKIILTTPNSYFWFMKILNFFGVSPKKLQRKDHKQFFDIKFIRDLFPKAEIYGYFPYCILKLKIKRFVGLLSPTFVIYESKVA